MQNFDSSRGILRRFIESRALLASLTLTVLTGELPARKACASEPAVPEYSEKNLNAPLLKVGALVPEIRLLDNREELRTLSSLRGKIVLLNLGGTWCAPCKKEIPALKALHEEFKDTHFTGDAKGFEIFSISFESEVEKWRRFVAEREMNWIHVREEMSNFKTNNALGGIEIVPQVFLIDEKGVLIQRDGDIASVRKELLRRSGKVIPSFVSGIAGATIYPTDYSLSKVRLSNDLESVTMQYDQVIALLDKADSEKDTIKRTVESTLSRFEQSAEQFSINVEESFPSAAELQLDPKKSIALAPGSLEGETKIRPTFILAERGTEAPTVLGAFPAQELLVLSWELRQVANDTIREVFEQGPLGLSDQKKSYASYASLMKRKREGLFESFKVLASLVGAPSFQSSNSH